MRLVAFVILRNERRHLGNFLDYLQANGVGFHIIDNESDDGSERIARDARYTRSLVGYETYPYRGYFDWAGLLAAREAAMQRTDADWFVTTSPDEIIHSSRDEGLVQAVERLDRAGYDVINCDEFVFLPVDHDYLQGNTGPQPLRYYYFFEPHPKRLMRFRRAGLALSHQRSGGHVLEGARFRLAPESFVLRHYIVRNQAHARRKYVERRFSEQELAVGWHSNRHGRPAERFEFPDRAELHCLETPSSREFDRSRPRSVHYWDWPRIR